MFVYMPALVAVVFDVVAFVFGSLLYCCYYFFLVATAVVIIIIFLLFLARCNGFDGAHYFSTVKNIYKPR